VIHLLNSIAEVLLPVGYVLTSFMYAMDFQRCDAISGKWKTRMLLGTVIAHFLYIGMHTAEYGRCMVTTPFEIMSLIAFTLAVTYTILELRTGERGTGVFILSLATWLLAMNAFRKIIPEPGDLPGRRALRRRQKSESDATYHNKAIYRDFEFFYKITLALVAGVVVVICKTACPDLDESLLDLLLTLAGCLQLVTGLAFSVFVMAHQRSKIRKWSEKRPLLEIFLWQETWMFCAMLSVSSALAAAVLVLAWG